MCVGAILLVKRNLKKRRKMVDRMIVCVMIDEYRIGCTR